MKYVVGIAFVIAYYLLIFNVIYKKYEKRNFDTFADIILVTVITYGIIIIECLLVEKTGQLGEFIKDVHNVGIFPTSRGFAPIDMLLIVIPGAYCYISDETNTIRKIIGISMSIIGFCACIFVPDKLGLTWFWC